MGDELRSFLLARWAVVQLAGRRILAPLIKVRVLAAQPTQLHRASPSSSRPRTTAFHAVDRGSNPLGDAKKIKPLREIVRAFSLWGKSAPPDAPQIRKKFFPASQGKASRSRGGLNENESGRSGCVLPIHAAGDKFLSAALVIKMWHTETSCRMTIHRCVFPLRFAVAAFSGIL